MAEDDFGIILDTDEPSSSIVKGSFLNRLLSTDMKAYYVLGCEFDSYSPP